MSLDTVALLKLVNKNKKNSHIYVTDKITLAHYIARTPQ